MDRNDVLRRIRYIFDFNDDKMMDLFKQGGYEVTREQVSNWLKKNEHPDYVIMSPRQLSSFLNGLIVNNRGKKDGQEPLVETEIDNNMIFMKLKIALTLKAEDIIGIMQGVDFDLGKGELSAFFRNSQHKHYRECKDQILRNFLKGLQHKHRPETESDSPSIQR